MLPELDALSTVIAFIAVVVVGVGGLLVIPVGMDDDIVLTMVLPSMLVFGGIMLAIGVAHGQYRGRR